MLRVWSLSSFLFLSSTLCWVGIHSQGIQDEEEIFVYVSNLANNDADNLFDADTNYIVEPFPNGFYFKWRLLYDNTTTTSQKVFNSERVFQLLQDPVSDLMSRALVTMTFLEDKEHSKDSDH